MITFEIVDTKFYYIIVQFYVLFTVRSDLIIYKLE